MSGRSASVPHFCFLDLDLVSDSVMKLDYLQTLLWFLLRYCIFAKLLNEIDSL